MASSWPLLEKTQANNALLRTQQGQGARTEDEVAEEPAILKLGVYDSTAGADGVGGCDCGGDMGGAAAAAAANGGGGGSGSGSAAAGGGRDGETKGVIVARLLALPEAILSEVLGYLAVGGIGRVSCTCRHLRDACADERIWVSLWEGPLPRGFLTGGRAAHVALWLLAKGAVEQTRVAVCEPVATSTAGGGVHEGRMANRRRMGDSDASQAGAAGGAGAGGGGFGGGGEEGVGAGGGGGAAGFPVHVSCMAISGGAMATAAGPDITVWNLGEAAPRARFRVDGHGSVTYLLFRNGTLLAGDNSGYLRSYDISVAGGKPLQQIRTHTDRVTAIDAFTFSLAGDDDDDNDHAPRRDCGKGSGRLPRASGGDARGAGRPLHAGRSPSGGESARPAAWWAGADGGGATAAAPAGGGGCGAGAAVGSSGGGGDGGGGGFFGGGRQRRWDQGHGWGEGWEVEGAGEEATPAAAAAAATTTGTITEAANGTVAAGLAAGEAPARPSRQGTGASPHAAGGGVGVGRGCGRGRGARLGGGGGGGSGMAFGTGELASLGKRQAYAGRGQRESAPDAEARGHAIDGQWGRGGGYFSGEAVARRDEKEEEGRAVLITGSDDGTAKAWDAASGRFVCMYAGHTRGVTCLQATSTESYGPVLVTGGGDSAVIIWELATGRFLEKLETGVGLAANPDGHGPRVGCLQAFNDRIVVGEDRHVSVWSLSKGQRPRLSRVSFCEHQRPIRRLDVVGRWIVTCSGDYVIRLWDSKTGHCVREMGTKSGAAITSFRLSGLCLLTTSLFDESVLMTRFLEPLPTGRPRADQTKKATRQNSCWCCGGRVTDGAAPLL